MHSKFLQNLDAPWRTREKILKSYRNGVLRLSSDTEQVCDAIWFILKRSKFQEIMDVAEAKK